MNENRPACWPPNERCPAFQERKSKAPGPAPSLLGARILEPQLNERRKAPGTENHRWRKEPNGLLTIGRGSGGGKASPC